ncbi:hypothetical protein BDQ12DRAFT_692825 [Crucibulum laeve]|uniref:Uncharacterized protein n=1 Tax=Crucibulum laeve TaxID=68775 RepID=A0A5C3LHX7_9AGAR|nr:hypothetical protein BDQ12DRAFT_692825 [Crucibulum laeve]
MTLISCLVSKGMRLTGSYIVTSSDASGVSSILFIYFLDYTRICLTNDPTSTKGRGACRSHGLVDVYKISLASDLHGFIPFVISSSSIMIPLLCLRFT